MTNFRISAKEQGAWGNDISVQIRASSRVTAQRADDNSLAQLDTVPLASAKNFYVGAIVEFNTGSRKHLPESARYRRHEHCRRHGICCSH